jgi:hypothetical protein
MTLPFLGVILAFLDITKLTKRLEKYIDQWIERYNDYQYRQDDIDSILWLKVLSILIGVIALAFLIFVFNRQI